MTCTDVVLGFFVLVSLLVGLSLLLIWLTCLLIQGLPSVSKNFADLACTRESAWSARLRSDIVSMVRTEADTWVLIANVLTLLVGKEHVSRETTLGRVGI